MPKPINKGTKRAKPLEDSGSDSEPRGKNDFLGFDNSARYGDIPEYVRFVYIMVEGVADIRKINFGLYKSINNYCGEVKSAKFTNRNSLLVETVDRAQFLKLIKMKSIINNLYQVKIEPALNIGTTKGTIYAPDLFDIPDNELNDLIKESNHSVIEISRMFKGPQKAKTPLLKLTFGNSKLPEEIKIGFINYRTSPFYPNPMICKKCKKFGHSSANCRGNIVCGTCAEDHLDELCPEQNIKCPNCSGDHSAFDRKCPMYLKEKNIMKTKVDLNISFPEARKIHQNPSYSTIVGKPVEPTITQDIKKQIAETVKSTVVELIKDVQNDPTLDKDQALKLILEKINPTLPESTKPSIHTILKARDGKPRSNEHVTKSPARISKSKQTNPEPNQTRASSSTPTVPSPCRCSKSNPKRHNDVQNSPMEH